MGVRFNSAALEFVNRALQIADPGSVGTVLDDERVVQTFDVTNAIRRSLVEVNQEGIFTAILRNVHTDAEGLVTVISPYTIGTALARAPFPAAIPRSFDLWLISAAMMRISGGGTINASLLLGYEAANQAFGVDDSGNNITGNTQHAIGFWDAFTGTTTVFGIEGGQNPWKRLGIRLARAAALRFESTSSLTLTVDCQLVFGLFPVTLGQDALS